MHKKNLFYWLTYDVANSFLVASIGGLFLSQWLILDNGLADIWYSGAFTLATILVLLTSPFWGAWSDNIGKRMPFIRWLTIILIIFDCLLALIAPSSYPVRFRVFFVLIMVVFIQYFYQLSLIFYNVLLGEVSDEENRGKISGLGEALGNLSWLLASVILLQFTTGKITLLGEPGRAQAFLPGFILFAVLSLLMLFGFKEKAAIVINTAKFNLKVVYKNTIQGLKELVKKDRNVAIFLLAFCLISDAILTIEIYFAIIMDRLYHISDIQKMYILTLMFVFVGLGSYLFGRISDRFGVKKILVFSCLGLVIILSIAFLSSNYFVLYLLAFFGGLGYGGFYATSRALMIKITPISRLGEYFGFYSSFQRFASIIGPLMWGAIILLLKNYDILKYQIAAFSLIALMLIGVFILKSVKENHARFPFG